MGMKTLALTAGILVVVFAGMIAAGAATSSAGRGGCPTERSSGSATHANENSAHGSAKGSARDCFSEIPQATATPAPTPLPTPSPSPSPTPAPTPVPGADVKVVSVTLTAPATGTTGVQFPVSAVVSLHNNGPVASVNVDTTFSLTLPAGCTAPHNNLVVTIANKSLPSSTSVQIMRSWFLVCSSVGDHTFNVGGSVAFTPGQAWTDPNPANNSGSGGAMTSVSTPVP